MHGEAVPEHVALEHRIDIGLVWQAHATDLHMKQMFVAHKSAAAVVSYYSLLSISFPFYIVYQPSSVYKQLH